MTFVKHHNTEKRTFQCRTYTHLLQVRGGEKSSWNTWDANVTMKDAMEWGGLARRESSSRIGFQTKSACTA